MRFRALIPVLALLVLQVACGTSHEASARTPRRIACIGDSITFGANIEIRERDSYPAVLQRLLGARAEVRNLGVSGVNLLKKGDKPYWQETAFGDATRFQPDIVIILLGTNDTKPQNWVHRADFAVDLQAFVEHFATLPSKPRIWLCLPPPVYQSRWGINQPVLDELIPMIRQVARMQKIPVIDLSAPLSNHPDYFADGIHPNEKGARVIADTIYHEINSDVSRRE